MSSPVSYSIAARKQSQISQLRQYVITSDSHPLIISEIKIAKEGKNAGQEVMSTIGYYPKLDQLIKRLITIEVHKDDIQSLQDMSDRVDGLSAPLFRQIREAQIWGDQ